MRTYELMYVLKPDLAEEVIAEVKEKLHKIIDEFGGEFVSEADGWQKAPGLQN